MIPSNAIADNRVINENGLLVELGEDGNYKWLIIGGVRNFITH